MKRQTVTATVFLSTAILFLVLVGSAGADGGGLRREVQQVEVQVTTLQGQVDNLQNNNAALTSAISALQKSNVALTSAISTLQASLNSFASPGEVLWTYYETTEPYTACEPLSADPNGCNVGGAGDNIIRLINPNGSPNPGLAGVTPHPVCAMIYVFDDDQEMGECCGCPLSSTQLATVSVKQNLTSNWALEGGPVGGEHSNGSISIVATAPNTVITTSTPNNGSGCPVTQSGACNSGCDPSALPGYSVSMANNLLGTITHNQEVQTDGGAGFSSGLTEVGLSDDRAGDQTNLVYLQQQCAAIVGNGSGAGICNCPVE